MKIQLTFIIIVLSLFPTVGVACICRSRTPQESFADAHLAIIGTVLKRTAETVTLKVGQIYKGRIEETITIYSPRDECSPRFTEGEKYLIYIELYKIDQQTGAIIWSKNTTQKYKTILGILHCNVVESQDERFPQLKNLQFIFSLHIYPKAPYKLSKSS